MLKPSSDVSPAAMREKEKAKMSGALAAFERSRNLNSNTVVHFGFWLFIFTISASLFRELKGKEKRVRMIVEPK